MAFFLYIAMTLASFHCLGTFIVSSDLHIISRQTFNETLAEAAPSITKLYSAGIVNIQDG